MKTLVSLTLLSLSLSSFAQNKNFAELGIKWSKNQISVCWGKYGDERLMGLGKLDDVPSDPSVYLEYSHAEKVALQNLVTKEFTKIKTGLEFVGWKKCTKTINPDVVFIKVNDVHTPYIGQATLGESGIRVSETFSGKLETHYVKSKSKVRNSLVINIRKIGTRSLSYDQHLSLVFLHELGHTAGLRHEFIDPETTSTLSENLEDPNCLINDIYFREPLYVSTRKFGVYDTNSVMNFCYLYFLEKIGLDYSIPTGPATEMQPSLIDPAVITKTQSMSKKNYNIRIGLSSGDQNALKCMYQYDAKTFLEKCHSNYDPKPKLR